MKSNSKVKKKLLIAAVAVLAIVVAVILVCAAYLHAGRSSLRGQGSRDAEMLYEGHSYMYDEDNINILCIGVDARGEADTVGQGDALILVTLNVRDKTIRSLISTGILWHLSRYLVLRANISRPRIFRQHWHFHMAVMWLTVRNSRNIRYQNCLTDFRYMHM